MIGFSKSAWWETRSQGCVILSLEKLKEVIPERLSIDAEFVDARIKKLNLDKDAKILEIGTGFGTMTIILAINGFNVLTGEPEYTCHHDWRKAAKAIGVEHKITYQQLDAEQLSFPEDSFDGIFMHITLLYILNKEGALNECLRVIKPNGLIVIVEDNHTGIEYFRNKHGSHATWPHPLDPRKIIHRDDVSTEVITGTYVDLYILKKRRVN